MKNDIIKDSYYMIKLFENDNKEITHRQLQDLMFFVEAYYMNANNKKSMYNCKFEPCGLGPVALPLQRHYCGIFEGNTITLNDEEKNETNNIPLENKQIIKKIYNTFKDLTFTQLTDLIYNSPWKKAWIKSLKNMNTNKNYYINKKETKKWFKNEFITNDKYTNIEEIYIKCPDYVIALLEKLQTQMNICANNNENHNFDDPFDNTGGTFNNTVFEVQAYDWNESYDDDYIQEYNFKYKKIKIKWYKYLGRDTVINGKYSYKEIINMFNECMKSLTRISYPF